jgi:hypothetical protein
MDREMRPFDGFGLAAAAAAARGEEFIQKSMYCSISATTHTPTHTHSDEQTRTAAIFRFQMVPHTIFE